jgi:hypothetical protein
MGRHQTTIFDLIGLLIPLEAAAVLAVLGYQWRGWSAALMAPVAMLLAVFVIAGVVRRIHGAGRQENE